MFSGKKILLVCKETYSYPLYFLAKKWSKQNEIAAFFFNPCESMYKSCILNNATYYAYKKLENVKVYDSNNIVNDFTKILNSETFDKDYLEEIESKYTHFANLNLQIVSTQFLTRHYHFRNYMKPCKYEQQLNWLILNYKNIISILDDFKPDVIVDCDTAELARTILNEVAYVRQIPYITPSFLRYENYLTFSYSLGKKIEPLFIKEYEKALSNPSKDAADYVKQFKEKLSIMPDRFKNTVTAQYKPKSIIKSLKIIYGMIRYFWNQDISAGNLKLKHTNKVLFNWSLPYIWFYIKYEFKNRRFLMKNKYFHNPKENENYIYMPLHLIPESTTATLSPIYINELTLIEAVSKSLPAGWWLYVKEHQSMLGERGTEFYKRVNKLPNVRLVQINYYQDPKPWITNAKGVVTISGTTAYEAALLGKPAMVFSDVPFSLIESVFRENSLENIAKTMEKFKNFECTDVSSVAYITASKQLGYSINLKYLMDEGERIIRGQSIISDEFEKNLNNLEKLFFDAYNFYESE